jgi:hypothetical protein
LDEPPELLLAAAERRLGGFLLGDIAGRRHDVVIAIVPLRHPDEHDVDRASDAGNRPLCGVSLVSLGGHRM